MPPKAIEQTEIDDLLCDMMPKGLSKSAKLSLINDQELRRMNTAFDFNYKQLTEIGASIDITNDYALMARHAILCIETLKEMWK
jgi:hypothetical protein